SLIVEPKTVFYNLMNKGKLPLPGEDMETVMFEMLIEHMESKGRMRYEISNFARPDYESIHNLLYWENETYAGIGAGAHGYVSGNRYSNIGPIKRYMEQVGNGIRPIQQSHIVTPVEAMEEEMFLGLRKTDGISTALFHEKFGQSLTSVYGETIQALIDKELIEVNGDRV
ncbi:oxygen-independent coproporphyrinogen III oxidase, partial [Microvirga sp. 3-52]|nr:oxygen-independent coproporphyrinogen III oxidase [Microvirga sp. 3-52]